MSDNVVNKHLICENKKIIMYNITNANIFKIVSYSISSYL